MNQSRKRQEGRLYLKEASAVFCKTKDKFGEFQNMHMEFPIAINNRCAHSSEALYHALKFSEHPAVQEKLLAEKRPMATKFIALQNQHLVRPDWLEINIPVMRFVVRLKFLQHADRLNPILEETGDLPIVEISSKDDFWGAKPIGHNKLFGVNGLGRLIREHRNLVKYQPDKLLNTSVPNIPGLTLLSEKIDDRDLW